METGPAGLIAGFWLTQVKSKDEAIEWVKRCPNPLTGEAEIEIRQVFEAAARADSRAQGGRRAHGQADGRNAKR